jgi:hypothetical protein
LGQVAFEALLFGDGGPQQALGNAIYAGAASNPMLIARNGNAAPGAGAGVTYDVGNPQLNDTGQLAYGALLSGPGITSDNNAAIYSGPIGNATITVREGPAPGLPAGIVHSPDMFAFNDVGHLAYTAALSGAGVTDDVNDLALFSNGQLAIRTGSAAPGAGAGVVLDGFGFQIMSNDLDQVVVIATLDGDGVTEQNDKALYAFDPADGMLLVAREGAPFDLGGGDVRTVSDGSIGLFFGANDDAPRSLGNDGTLAFSLRFTDGTSGVFTVAIPEPASAAVVLAGAIAWALPRPRRRVR